MLVPFDDFLYMPTERLVSASRGELHGTMPSLAADTVFPGPGRRHAARSLHAFPIPLPLLFMALLGLFLSGCAGRVSTEEIRSGISYGEIAPLRERLEKSFADYDLDLVIALNLARAYQMEGKWSQSIAIYNHALAILEEYEGRAVISLRNLAGDAGTYLLSRGALGYYGTGYERSLLHTFNAFNYMMLGDFTGAAVEMRKMEHRQDLWLLEMETRINQYLEKKSELPGHTALPAGYSMRELLESDEVRALMNNYQEPFSYALSSIFNRLADNPAYAEVSMRRAAALEPASAGMFQAGWGKGGGTPALPAVPPLPPPLSGGADADDAPAEQEVTVIVLRGLAPALRVEHLRIPFPYVGYITVDLPAFTPPMRDQRAVTIRCAGNGIGLVPLLFTERLAYRTLRDEVSMETTSAFSRAMVRASASAGTRAVLASNENTEPYAELGGLLVTVLLDLISYSISDSVRNWEMLPNHGSIGMGRVPRGETLSISLGPLTREIPLPVTARGAIVIISQLPNSNLRVDHVLY